MKQGGSGETERKAGKGRTSMQEFDYTEAARASGFATVAPLAPDTLRHLPEVREMCAADRCRSYGKNWACPPVIGTLDEWAGRCARYSHGLLLQTIGEREDSFDYEAMMEAERANRTHIDALADRLCVAGADFLLLAAGTCTRCPVCTCPDAPCRCPERLFPSMEAAGLFVSQVCRDNSVVYYYGEEKIAYTNCLLFRP